MSKFKPGDLLVRYSFYPNDDINTEIMRVVISVHEYGYKIYYADGYNCAFLNKNFVEEAYKKVKQDA